jgi:hypothetical protein
VKTELFITRCCIKKVNALRGVLVEPVSNETPEAIATLKKFNAKTELV